MANNNIIKFCSSFLMQTTSPSCPTNYELISVQGECICQCVQEPRNECPRNKWWNINRCECVCHVSCLPGYYQNPRTCQCIIIETTDGTVGPVGK